MKQVYDNNGIKIAGLYRSGDALVVKDDILLTKAKAEKERLSKINDLEQRIDVIASDMAAIKTLLEKLVRE